MALLAVVRPISSTLVPVVSGGLFEAGPPEWAKFPKSRITGYEIKIKRLLFIHIFVRRKG
jgi:hypothetical protein